MVFLEENSLISWARAARVAMQTHEFLNKIPCHGLGPRLTRYEYCGWRLWI